MLKYRKYFYSLSAILVIASIASLAIFGLNFGIDFTGGSLLEVEFEGVHPDQNEVKESLTDLELGEIVIQSAGEQGFIMRFKSSATSTVDEATHQNILSKLREFPSSETSTTSTINELRFESIGPIIGGETKRKSIWAIFLVVIMILIYVAWAFRRVSFPLKSWQYGVAALIALFHDVIIAVGVFSLLGYFLNIEVGVPFVAALLTILGYSVNDTIVVFDRVRENVLRQGSMFNFASVIDRSVEQTYVRSLNTSLTTLFVLVAVFLFGGATIQYFVLALIIGVVAGTYSSLFLATPLLFSWSVLKLKKR